MGPAGCVCSFNASTSKMGLSQDDHLADRETEALGAACSGSHRYGREPGFELERVVNEDHNSAGTGEQGHALCLYVEKAQRHGGGRPHHR